MEEGKRRARPGQPEMRAKGMMVQRPESGRLPKVAECGIGFGGSLMTRTGVQGLAVSPRSLQPLCTLLQPVAACCSSGLRSPSQSSLAGLCQPAPLCHWPIRWSCPACRGPLPQPSGPGASLQPARYCRHKTLCKISSPRADCGRSFLPL